MTAPCRDSDEETSSYLLCHYSVHGCDWAQDYPPFDFAALFDAERKRWQHELHCLCRPAL